jgi:hypothetical protein
VQSIGPAIILPEKTRIAFQVRMSFAQVTPRQRWLDGHVVLVRRLEHPRLRTIEMVSPRNHLHPGITYTQRSLTHGFRLEKADHVENTFVAWLREADDGGEQKHGRDTR